ncbi:MAG TPA: SOS response-associated peptidase [Paraburkholderia sp.]
MCGRYARARYGIDYLIPLAADRDSRWPLLNGAPPADTPSWNAAPGSRQPVIYPDGIVRLVHWGYRPAWAVAKGIPQMVNAKLEKAGSSAWAAMWKNGRILVPADYWYEWKTESNGKQPYAIQAKSGEPLYVAGLTNVRPDMEPRECDGFVIVTAEAGAGLVDVHDRRPVVFSADVAREYLDPGTSAERAVQLAQTEAEPPEAFTWFPVSRKVNRPGPDGPDLVEPIQQGPA